MAAEKAADGIRFKMHGKLAADMPCLFIKENDDAHSRRNTKKNSDAAFMADGNPYGISAWPASSFR